MAVQQLVSFSSSTLENLPNYRFIDDLYLFSPRLFSGVFPYVSFFHFFKTLELSNWGEGGELDKHKEDKS